METNSTVTVADLDGLVKAIFDQKNKIREMEAEVSKENVALAALEAKAVLYLEELGRDNYKAEQGNIAISEKWRFKLPQTPEDKQLFFDYLKEKQLFDKYATVQSAQYNAYCNVEWEIAKQEGRGMEFSLPGVPEPTLFKALSTRKA